MKVAPDIGTRPFRIERAEIEVRIIQRLAGGRMMGRAVVQNDGNFTPGAGQEQVPPFSVDFLALVHVGPRQVVVIDGAGLFQIAVEDRAPAVLRLKLQHAHLIVAAVDHRFRDQIIKLHHGRLPEFLAVPPGN